MIVTLALALLASVTYGNRYGDANCPCLGPEAVAKIPDGQQNKEIGYGSDCRPWDIQMGYCVEKRLNPDDPYDGHQEGSEWCEDDWCYVDPNDCGDVFVNGVSVDPKVAGSVIYPQIELYFSYHTCGNEDRFEDSGTDWVWDFGECLPRTPNDYYLLVDGSDSVSDQWDNVLDVLQTIMDSGLNRNVTNKDDPDWVGDRVGIIEFSGHRAFQNDKVVKIVDLDESKDRDLVSQRIAAMTNLGGQTWTLMGLQDTVEAIVAETSGGNAITTPDRERVVALITDGRPKPRQSESTHEDDSPEPGCITKMLDLSLEICDNGDKVGDPCRFQNCADINMATTDCCPGEQDPCAAGGETDALIQDLKDNNIILAVIAVDTGDKMKSNPFNCQPTDCNPQRTDCVCEYEVYYFNCLLKEDYDQSNPTIPHRITTIDNFDSFFQYKDPTATEDGGVDGQICIDPKLLLPPAPPTSSCTEIPEPKDVVILLDSSKSMYTKSGGRGGTAVDNWLQIMHDLQGVICLFNSAASPDIHRCAFTTRDNVGLVRFATNWKVEWDFNSEGQWWTNINFVVSSGGNEVSNMNRKELFYMTDTAAALWEALDMMAEMDEDTVILPTGQEIPKRREIIIVTDGRPHCKRDSASMCRPCGSVARAETDEKMRRANAEVKMVWRGDRTTHDGSIPVDKDELAQDEWFGCLNIDFDSDEDFVTIENFDQDVFRDFLMGDLVCVQQQE